MANMYENPGVSIDPFRERPPSPASPPPPTSYNINIPPMTAAHTQASPLNTQSVPSYGYDSSAKTGHVNSSAVPHGGGPVGGYGAPAAAAASVRPTTPVPAASDSDASPQPTSKFWKIEFYQQFFDVNTRQVLIRMSNTLVPLNPPDFLLDRNWHYTTQGPDGGAAPSAPAAPHETELVVDGVTLSRKPDLYGPFWICTTLWMTLGIVSNVMGKIAATRAKRDDWRYDFSAASVACVVMYLYCFVFGAIVWGLMAWKRLPVTFSDTVCLYGYSMFIFILTALLCMVPSGVAQWVFCILGGLWSTAYLLINFWHMWKASLERTWFIGIVALVSLCHFGLTLSFKFYFLRYKY